MKKIFFILTFLSFALAGISQGSDKDVQRMKERAVQSAISSFVGGDVKVSKDIFDNVIIEDNRGNRKTVKVDVFDNVIVEDGREIKLL